MRVLAPAIALALGSSTSAWSRDIVVFDRGAGEPRTRSVRAAFQGGGDTVLTDVESAELDREWATRCTDAACYARAGVAGSVALVVLVEASRIVAIDVATTERQRPVTTEADIDAAVFALQHPEAFGTLRIDGLEPGTVVLVDGQPFRGGELAVGRHTVSVQARPTDAPVVTEVAIAALTATTLPRPAPPPTTSAVAAAPTTPTTPTTPMTPLTPTTPASPAPSLHPGFIVGGVGGGLVGVGVVIAAVGEVSSQQALDALKRRESADLAGAEAVLATGVVVGVVGLAAGVGGVVWAAVSAPE